MNLPSVWPGRYQPTVEVVWVEAQEVSPLEERKRRSATSHRT